MLTGRVVKMDKRLDGSPSNVWNRLVKRSGEPVIRSAMNQAMAIMGKQFVLGRDINEALKQARDYRKMGYSYSFDMLGEAAMTQDDADRYLKDYLQAIEAVGNDPYPQNNAPRPSISIKLSALHPQLASHNAHTVAAVLAMAKKRNRKIEFQRLHGMGDALYNSILQEHDIPVRIYAPVGAHKDLLPYLVRRLLENGANSSFVHRLVDAGTPIEDLVQNPVQELQKYDSLASSRIPGPMDIFGERRSDGDKTEVRALCLEKFANLMEKHMEELMALCCQEAGKTMQDGIDEVREAVDFCRYYANDGRARFAKAIALPGPTGESNELYMEGRGVFLCISPWNFPLAIYTGQIMAALVAGNTVIAKPAEQTSLVAMRGMELMLEAGFPANVLQFLPGDGARLGKVLTPDSRIAGVCFTGSTQVARVLNRTLAERTGAIVPLIAETGGQNAMIVDSSALPEQVVRDVVQSAFASAGQCCSALRVLYVQQDVADRMETLLAGAMNELVVGNP